MKKLHEYFESIEYIWPYFLTLGDTYNYLFSAPEIQHKSECSIASDMFSLGMLMIAAFNGGQSIIQANHSTNLYFKQAGVVNMKFSVGPRILSNKNMSIFIDYRPS